jgi:hypothetical protein
VALQEHERFTGRSRQVSPERRYRRAPVPPGTRTTKESVGMFEQAQIERMIEDMLDRPAVRDLDWVAARFGHR